MINDRDWSDYVVQFNQGQPFRHVVIEDFWLPEVAEQLVQDIPDYESNCWHAHYLSPIEDKKVCNDWNRFPEVTYKAFAYLNSNNFVKIISQITNNQDILTDVGLNGGGWHSHHKGGKLNIHLDYSIHPKLKLERLCNLIVYLTPDWNPAWRGGLEFWSHNPETKQPKDLVKTVENRFNRAVLFDTTQNSWHGLPDDLICPEGVCRNSMAIFYLTTPRAGVDDRGKALFVPNKDQTNDPEILEIIKKRSNTTTASSVYRK